MMHSTLDDRAQLANYCSKRCDRRFRNRGSFERFLLWFDPWDQEWVQMLTRSPKNLNCKKVGYLSHPNVVWPRIVSYAFFERSVVPIVDRRHTRGACGVGTYARKAVSHRCTSIFRAIGNLLYTEVFESERNRRWQIL